MFATLLSATLISALSIQGALADFSVDTPTLTQCGSSRITWTDGTGPYNLAVVPVDDPCNTILADLGDHNGMSMTWNNVTLAAGTQVLLSLLDSADGEAWSGTVTVADGDSSCLPNASSAVSEVASATSDVSSLVGSATTLVLTSSFPTVAKSASAETESATIVGAANAGTLGNASGAMSNVRLPAAATVFATLVAAAAVLAL